MLDFRAHFTFANVTSFTALFVALSGGAYAAVTIRANSITAAQLASNSVGRTELKAGSVGSSELRDSAIGAKQIQDGSVDVKKLNLSGIGPVFKDEIGFDLDKFNKELADLRAKAEAAKAAADGAQGAATGAAGAAEGAKAAAATAQAAAGGAQATADGAKAQVETAGGSVAYARVNTNGTIDVANSKNVAAGTEDVAESGVVCLKLTGGVTAKNVTASIDISGADSRDSIGVTLAPAAVASKCAPGDSAAVGTANWATNTFADRPFYIVFH